MNDKRQTQMILLQFLGIASLIYGRTPRVATAVNLLTDLILNRWDELWSIVIANQPSRITADHLCKVDTTPEEEILLRFGQELAEQNNTWPGGL
jgi:hypothetical protein